MLFHLVEPRRQQHEHMPQEPPESSSSRQPPQVFLPWIAACAALSAAVVAATLVSHVFVVERQAQNMPIAAFALTFTALGLAFLAMIPLIERSEALGASTTAGLVGAVFSVGLVWRLLLVGSEPILEVDFNRYLWDGGLTANGFNPYAMAPRDVTRLPYDDVRLELAKAAASIFERISYAQYKTIYPPVAQAAFALSHLLANWSLTAWRLIAIAADVVTFALLLALLRETGRSPVWIALYWWCPLVLKEIANSAHMEAILLPLVLASLLLAIRGRHLGATVALGLAIGTKLWPIMLAPLILRPVLDRPRQLIAAVAILAGFCAATATPIWLGGLDPSSGFVGFASYWATNSALFPILQRAVASITGTAGTDALLPGRIVRLASAAVVLGLAVQLSWRPILDARDLLRRACMICSVLLLLSPAQFPWYVLWVLPLATLNPGIGWHVAAATMPLYYSAFHFVARKNLPFFETWIVWLIWVPIWLALASDYRRNSRSQTGLPGRQATGDHR